MKKVNLTLWGNFKGVQNFFNFLLRTYDRMVTENNP